jgi:hypothetical protein
MLDHQPRQLCAVDQGNRLGDKAHVVMRVEAFRAARIAADAKAFDALCAPLSARAATRASRR